MARRTRNETSDDLELNHEINVTPFIDVMLVLLIIFMVAAPLATVDVNIDLPASSATAQPRPDKPIYVTLQENQTINIGNEAVAKDLLQIHLDQISENNKDARIFLRADKNVDYGSLMNLMNDLRKAGYLKIALVGLELVGEAPIQQQDQQSTGTTPAAQNPNVQDGDQ